MRELNFKVYLHHNISKAITFFKKCFNTEKLIIIQKPQII